MIFNSQPQTWQELQDFIGQLFREIGFHVEVSKKVELVRGKKEIDVYVQGNQSEYHPVFLIECKFWNTPVDQETIHAFRTIMNDFGANFGFIVSNKGFQSGCYEAAEKTNIKLVSLEELESEFYKKWQSGMVKKWLPLTDYLFSYWDPSGGRMPKDGLPISWETLQLLTAAYHPIISLGNWDLYGEMKNNYPCYIPVLNDNLEVVAECTLRDDRDFFDFIEANQEKVILHFKKLYRE